MNRKALCLLAFGAVAALISAPCAFGGSTGSGMGGALCLATAWFDAGVGELGSEWSTCTETELEISENGTWTTESEIQINEAATYDTDLNVLQDTSSDLEFDFAAAKDVDLNTVTVNAEVMFEPYEFDGITYPEVPADAKGALMVFVDNNDAYSFYGLAKDANGTNAWTQLTGEGAEDAVGGTVDIAIVVDCKSSGAVTVEYSVDGVALTLGGESELDYVGNGFANYTVADVVLKNAVQVDSVTGSYIERDFTPAFDNSEIGTLAGVDNSGNTLSFTVNVETNRDLGTITYGVVIDGVRHNAEYNESSGKWEIELNLERGVALADVGVCAFYQPYKSSGGVIETNVFATVDICQGKPYTILNEDDIWIHITAETYNDAALSGGTWDTAPTVDGGKLSFRDSSVFTATEAAEEGVDMGFAVVVSFPSPNDLTVEFSDMDTVPQGAFALVQTAGDSVSAEDAQFRLAFYGNGAWATNTSYVAYLETNYAVAAKFDYGTMKVTYEFNKADDSDKVQTYEMDIASTAGTLQNVGFDGEGEVTSVKGAPLKLMANDNLVKVGDTEYASLEEAIAATNAEYTLLWDQTFDPEGYYRLAIDTNGYLLVLEDGSHMEQGGGYCYFSTSSDYEASINTTNFWTLGAAVDNAGEDAVVVMRTNILHNLEVASSRDFILDLNGLSITTNLLSTNVFVIAGKMAVTNSVAEIGGVREEGDNAIVTGTIVVDKDAELQIFGGYYTANIAAWVPAGFSVGSCEINGVTYNRVVLYEGNPVYFVDDQWFASAAEVKEYLDAHPGTVCYVLAELTSEQLMGNCVQGDVSDKLEGLNGTFGPLFAVGIDHFGVSNTTDVSKYILVDMSVSGDETNLLADVTTRDAFAYEGLSIAGVALEKNYGGDDDENLAISLALSNYVMRTVAYTNVLTTVAKVETDLVAERSEGNGLSLFANFVLGIELDGKVDVAHDQPLVGFNEADPQLYGGEGSTITIPGFLCGWEDIDMDDAFSRADSFGYKLGVSLYTYGSGRTESVALDDAEGFESFELPAGSGGRYRVDLLIEKADDE